MNLIAKDSLYLKYRSERYGRIKSVLLSLREFMDDMRRAINSDS